MNVFVLDKNMLKSASMLDDAHLKAQINEACQILTANYNKHHHAGAKIGHVAHSVTKYYDGKEFELCSYIGALLCEYRWRFRKEHQNWFWFCGYCNENKYAFLMDDFQNAKTYVDGQMTENIEKIRKYISKKSHVRPLTWTNREKPDWWKE